MNRIGQYRMEKPGGLAGPRWTWLLVCACASVWLTFAERTPAAGAQSTTISREYPLKAAYLYNFGSYVEWPADAFSSPQSPFVVGVIGGNPFGPILDDLASTKKVQGRPIVIRYLAAPADAAACHMVFIAARTSVADRLEIIEATRSSHVLTVSESAGMAERGTVVNFVVKQNKIRFEINVRAARDRDLKISSKLLSLARVVGTDGESKK